MFWQVSRDVWGLFLGDSSISGWHQISQPFLSSSMRDVFVRQLPFLRLYYLSSLTVKRRASLISLEYFHSHQDVYIVGVWGRNVKNVERLVHCAKSLMLSCVGNMHCRICPETWLCLSLLIFILRWNGGVCQHSKKTWLVFSYYSECARLKGEILELWWHSLLSRMTVEMRLVFIFKLVN